MLSNIEIAQKIGYTARVVPVYVDTLAGTVDCFQITDPQGSPVGDPMPTEQEAWETYTPRFDTLVGDAFRLVDTLLEDDDDEVIIVINRRGRECTVMIDSPLRMVTVQAASTPVGLVNAWERVQQQGTDTLELATVTAD